jgi:hypothetical protein
MWVSASSDNDPTVELARELTLNLPLGLGISVSPRKSISENGRDARSADMAGGLCVADHYEAMSASV